MSFKEMIDSILGRGLLPIEWILAVFILLGGSVLLIFGRNLWSSNNEENWHPIAKIPFFRKAIKVMLPVWIVAFASLIVSLVMAVLRNYTG